MGPTIGGFVAEAYNWRWVFFMTFPICVVSVLTVCVITDRERNPCIRLDWTGFLAALGIAVASFQLGDR